MTIATVVKVGPKGQILLKKSLREATGIQPGGVVLQELTGKGVLIKRLDSVALVSDVEAIAAKVRKRWPRELDCVSAVRADRA
ncbi:AbrB/MazE/SpoVT family DNA-binding domain-containing protein [Candidatus Woesearchaeota archaeon]|nr:AbrB/MazE/SpoVT family DNA-binding domain-containing protein [Candidatus Woesearchaeota archaeon]